MANEAPMMKEIMGFESSQLCFNKEDFFKDEFSVDVFVLRYRQQSGLENLRNDLGVYLKVLRSSMIDLINRDYADFVNLSSNLVGLDASIGKLEMPLGQLREEVLSVRRSFDDLLQQTAWRLSRLHEVRAQKQYLRLLGALPGYLERLEALLGSTAEQDGDALERAASEHNQLLYALHHCSGATLAGQLRPRADQLAVQLAAQLQDALMAALRLEDAEKLAHVLRIFATLDQVSVAESLFRTRLVEPYMEEAISPSALRDSPRGLRGVLENVLRFIPEKAQLLVTVTRREHGAQTGPRYDFLVNAVWPCVIQKLEDELSVIFAPGNPNTFFECFSAVLGFIESFEEACGSKASVCRLRNHEAYTRFMGRWNLPVYYQIRFQEIGGALEEALSAAGRGEGSGAAAVWAALQRCWHHSVFVRALTHRFWQLSLQTVARYKTAIQAQLQAQEPPTPQRCVAVLSELTELSGRLDTLLEVLVLPMLPDLPEDALGAMRASLATGADQLTQLRPQLVSCYTSQLLAAAAAAMRAVTDIPRLYRRTNRDAPTAPSAYVAAMVSPLCRFAEETCAGLERTLVAEYLSDTVTQLCTQYGERVGQVLTSVQRMEESLRKLKRPRASATTPVGPTDDQKIRSQLRLDVSELGARLERLQLRPAELQQYRQLSTLVANTQM